MWSKASDHGGGIPVLRRPISVTRNAKAGNCHHAPLIADLQPALYGPADQGLYLLHLGRNSLRQYPIAILGYQYVVFYAYTNAS